jgi:hypothetical protein
MGLYQVGADLDHGGASVLKRCPEVGVSVEADGAHATFACRAGISELDFL